MATLAPTHGFLYTTLINLTGKTRFFSFLPPHGRTLASNGTITFIGDPTAGLASGDPQLDVRNRNKLALALAAGDIGVISTPNPVIYDNTNHAAYTLQVAAGSLTAITGIDYGSHSTADAAAPGESVSPVHQD